MHTVLIKRAKSADKLAAIAFHPRLGDTSPAETVRDVLAVAEFLARESRALKDR